MNTTLKIEIINVKSIDNNYLGTLNFIINDKKYFVQDDFLNLLLPKLIETLESGSKEHEISFFDNPVYLKLINLKNGKMSICFLAEHSMGKINLTKEVVIEEENWKTEINKIKDQYKKILS